MGQRTFEHLYTELCLAVNQRVSRYALWLLCWESGADPDDLTRDQAQRIVESHLGGLLREEGLKLEGRRLRRLARKIRRFDPRARLPEEWLAL